MDTRHRGGKSSTRNGQGGTERASSSDAKSPRTHLQIVRPGNGRDEVSEEREPIQSAAVDPAAVLGEMVIGLRNSFGPCTTIDVHCGESCWRMAMDSTHFRYLVQNLCAAVWELIRPPGDRADRPTDSDVSGGPDILVELENVEVSDDYCEMNPRANPGEYATLSVTGYRRDDTGESSHSRTASSSLYNAHLLMVGRIVDRHGGWLQLPNPSAKDRTVRAFLPRRVEE